MLKFRTHGDHILLLARSTVKEVLDRRKRHDLIVGLRRDEERQSEIGRSLFEAFDCSVPVSRRASCQFVVHKRVCKIFFDDDRIVAKRILVERGRNRKRREERADTQEQLLLEPRHPAPWPRVSKKPFNKLVKLSREAHKRSTGTDASKVLHGAVVLLAKVEGEQTSHRMAKDNDRLVSPQLFLNFVDQLDVAGEHRVDLNVAPQSPFGLVQFKGLAMSTVVRGNHGNASVLEPRKHMLVPAGVLAKAMEPHGRCPVSRGRLPHAVVDGDTVIGDKALFFGGHLKLKGSRGNVALLGPCLAVQLSKARVIYQPARFGKRQ